jgi:hypothetical protein
MSPPSPLFISSKFSISGSLPTSSNRLNRQAHCSGRLTFQIQTQFLAARAFLGVLRPHQSASQSLLSRRETRLPRIFGWLLFASPFYSSTLQTVSPHHFISQALLIRLRVTNTGCLALAGRPWRTQGCLLYLVAQLHLPFFFRFDVLV